MTEDWGGNHLIGIAIAIEIGIVQSFAKCLSISNPIAISSFPRGISHTLLLGAPRTLIDKIGKHPYTQFSNFENQTMMPKRHAPVCAYKSGFPDNTRSGVLGTGKK